MKKSLRKFSSTLLLIFGLLFGALLHLAPVYADTETETPPSDITAPENPTDSESNPEDISEDTPSESDESPESGETDETGNEEPLDSETPPTTETGPNTCQDEGKGLSWILCSATQVAGSLSDTLYDKIESFLIVEPLTTDTNSAIYRVWDYMRGLTNIIFVIFIIIVIYSQITGLGISNYGVKRVLPRIIIAVILVNLSYIICSILIDASNIVGSSVNSVFTKIITDTGLNNTADNALLVVDWTDIIEYLMGGAAIAGLFVVGAGGAGAAFWTLVLLIIGVVFSVLTGLITIGMRQAVVMLLIMISPLAFVAYLLPNTEKWFDKWKALLFQMIFFYPMFSCLFGAAKLAGLAIIAASGGEIFEVIIGLAVQVLPLFLSVSLLKMSGTMLGKVSSGLDRAFGHAQRPLQDYALSQRHLAAARNLNSKYAPSGKLRNYLLERQKRREMYTATNLERANNRAIENALNHDMGFVGYDDEGKPIYRNKNPLRSNRTPSRNMLDAKAAKVQADRTALAQRNYANTLGEFTSIYDSKAATAISNEHGEVFTDIMTEAYRAENIAQADQAFLLNAYMKASKDNMRGDSYQYNRLIGRAEGGLGDIGRNTIMGQVIQQSVNIENRRRKEAAVVLNKFTYSKGQFRAMMFDMAQIDDDGYEIGEDGKPVEDWQYNLLPGKKRRRYQQYVAVNKKTKERISKEEYLALSKPERKNYDRVNYMDIYDDDGDSMVRVYADDAAYIKELFGADIAIGDPINRRYLNEIGCKRLDGQRTALTEGIVEKNGKFRKFHSTISAALRTTGYSEHDASITAMILAQANSGFLTTTGQRNIAMLDSIWKATKPGKFLQNDAIIIEQLRKLVASPTSTVEGERFSDIFKDEDIALYRNVNAASLKGMRKVIDEDGNYTWKTIDRNDPTLSIQDMKNYLIHCMIPEVQKKLLGMADRTMSPNVSDNMKPDGVTALYDLVDTILETSARNLDPAIPFEERANPDLDILEKRNPNNIKQRVAAGREIIASGNYHYTGPVKTAVQNTNQYLKDTDPIQALEELFRYSSDINSISDNIISIYENHPLLIDHRYEAQEVIEEATTLEYARNQNGVIQQNVQDNNAAILDLLYENIMNLTQSIIYGT